MKLSQKGDEAMIQDLTVGEPRKLLWRFALPLFFSAIFQQMYNLADSVIVGNFSACGEEALAAVGASYPIVSIFTSIALGCSGGCTVIISQLFGAKKNREMKTAVSTSLLSAALLSLLLALGGNLLAPAILSAIRTPANIFPDAVTYLRIYTAGFPFLLLYNVATAIFTSLGDSKTPLYFLTGSSLGNILLDYIFVAQFHWDVAGVAWATFLCQGAACVLACVTLRSRLRAVPCDGAPALFSLPLLGQISRIAIPNILEYSFVSVGNAVLQRLINGYGSAVIAGFSAAIKLNGFAVTCYLTVSNALASFTAQNVGAGQYGRIRQGFRSGVVMVWMMVACFFLLYFFRGEMLIGLFLKEDSPQALAAGMEFLRIVAPFYFLLCIKNILDGLLRGAGAMGWFLITTTVDLVLRVIFGYALSPIFGRTGLWCAWPIGWVVGGCLALFAYLRGYWIPKEVRRAEAVKKF